jgi:hypothetical protein
MSAAVRSTTGRQCFCLQQSPYEEDDRGGALYYAGFVMTVRTQTALPRKPAQT